jgi:hypothetical protein
MIQGSKQFEFAQKEREKRVKDWETEEQNKRKIEKTAEILRSAMEAQKANPEFAEFQGEPGMALMDAYKNLPASEFINIAPPILTGLHQKKAAVKEETEKWQRQMERVAPETLAQESAKVNTATELFPQTEALKNMESEGDTARLIQKEFKLRPLKVQFDWQDKLLNEAARLASKENDGAEISPWTDGTNYFLQIKSPGGKYDLKAVTGPKAGNVIYSSEGNDIGAKSRSLLSQAFQGTATPQQEEGPVKSSALDAGAGAIRKAMPDVEIAAPNVGDGKVIIDALKGNIPRLPNVAALRPLDSDDKGMPITSLPPFPDQAVAPPTPAQDVFVPGGITPPQSVTPAQTEQARIAEKKYINSKRNALTALAKSGFLYLDKNKPGRVPFRKEAMKDKLALEATTGMYSGPDQEDLIPAFNVAGVKKNYAQIKTGLYELYLDQEAQSNREPKNPEEWERTEFFPALRASLGYVPGTPKPATKAPAKQQALPPLRYGPPKK